MKPALLKKLGFTTVLLVLLWIVYLYRLVPHSQMPFAKALDSTLRIVLLQGPNKMELRKEGGAWETGPGAGAFYPADTEPLTPFLSGLKNLQVEDEISDRADRAAEYEVGPASGTQVELFGEKEAALAEGIFGKPAADGVHIYFRYPHKPNVYLARGITRGDLGIADFNAWRVRQFISIPEAKVQAMHIERTGMKMDFVQTSTNVWTINGAAADPGMVNALVGTLAHLKVEGYLDPAAASGLTYDGLLYGKVIVKGTDSSVDVRIGALDPKTNRYPVSVGPDSGFAWLSQAAINAIYHKPSEFIKKK
jgi:hypothetical protein